MKTCIACAEQKEDEQIKLNGYNEHLCLTCEKGIKDDAVKAFKEICSNEEIQEIKSEFEVIQNLYDKDIQIIFNDNTMGYFQKLIDKTEELQEKLSIIEKASNGSLDDLDEALRTVFG